MKTSLPKNVALLATMALASVALSARGDDSDGSIGKMVRVDKYVEPIFPASLLAHGQHEGSVEVLLLVAPDGRLLEQFVAASTNPYLSKSVETAVSKWTFLADPALAYPRRYSVQFTFQPKGIIVVTDREAIVNSFLGTKVDRGDAVEVCKISELDRVPDAAVPLNAPSYPPALRKQKMSGNVLISFYIDETGAIRVPSVAQATQPEFAMAALDAVKSWRFSPPTRKQIPVRVFAAQEFIFSADSPTAQGKTR